MIYRIENGQKVALDAMLDNNWDIEYNRDLASLLVDKSEWIATEECWFQFHSIWIREGSKQIADADYLRNMVITLNDVNVARMDYSQFDRSSSSKIETYILTSQLFMKKGDTVKFYSTASTGSSPVFNAITTHVFPIHRLLSSKENVLSETLKMTANSGSINGKYSVTLYPLGNNIYMFALPSSGVQYKPWSTDVNSLYFSIEGFDILDLKLDYWQVATGIPDYVGTTSSNTDPSQWIACVKPSNTNQNIFMRGSGIIRRQ